MSAAFFRVEPPALMGRATCPVCRCNLVHCSLAWALEQSTPPSTWRWLHDAAQSMPGDLHVIFCRNCADVVSVVSTEMEME